MIIEWEISDGYASSKRTQRLEVFDEELEDMASDLKKGLISEMDIHIRLGDLAREDMEQKVSANVINLQAVLKHIKEL